MKLGKMQVVRGSLEGPRWAGIVSTLKEYAFLSNNLDIEIFDIDKGLLRERVLFKVKGTNAAVQQFWNDLKKTVDEYNAQ